MYINCERVLVVEDIKALINRRRRQILIHSFIYYRLNSNIWTDEKFDSACNELVRLQAEYPQIAETCAYHEYFEGFDGSSGFDLPLHLPEVVEMGQKVLRLHQELHGKFRLWSV